MEVYAGIDVAGKKRGFHIAFISEANLSGLEFFHEHSVSSVIDALKFHKPRLRAIGIDCPPKAQIKGPDKREAERELRASGYIVQWTRIFPKPGAEWMYNGQKLWDELRLKFNKVQLLETFPRVSSDGLHGRKISLDFRLMAGKDKWKQRSDYLDAFLCAHAARAHTKNLGCKEYGINDELGPIHVLDKLS